MTNYYIQAPDEIRLYQQKVNGDTIASAIWTLDPVSGTIGTPINTVNLSTVSISSLTVGVDYRGKVRLTCTSGQVLDAAFTISCQNPQSPA